MKQIELSNGGFCLVDDKFEYLKEKKWYKSCGGYSGRMVSENGKRFMFLMHRFIMQAKKGTEVDHINGNKLDNRLCNLRFVTRAENNMNRHEKKTGTTSKYKGVCWRHIPKRWKAYIKINKKQIHIGYFGTELEAAKAYDKKAVELFGEFACLNFPINHTEVWA